MRGLIFNIQRFSLHDGPGIRTTVFFKGCPLTCKWCSNPESWKSCPEIIVYDHKCIGCDKCIDACSMEAITVVDSVKTIDWNKCNLCLECARVCPSKAIEQVGKYMTVEEVVAEAESDRLFYHNSGGGVTFSGGEPLLQWEFVREVAAQCKSHGIHTALDTSGYVRWDTMEKVLEYIDLVLYDIKNMDSQKHEEWTGVSNALILDNAARTASKVRTWIRVPLMPGYNDSESDLNRLAEFSARLGVEKVSLLPYHRWGEQKYGRLGMGYTLEEVEPPTDEHVQWAKEIVESHGIGITTGR